MITSWIPTVRKISDGEPVDQTEMNPILDQLIQRDQHLYDKFSEILGKSALMALDQPVHPTFVGSFPQNSLNIAYYAKDTDGEGLALTTVSFTSSGTQGTYKLANSNYAFGVTNNVSADGTTADLFISGLCDLTVDFDDLDHGLLANGETFQVGPYFLSRLTPGKLTSSPAGVPIYVGYALSKRQFLLNPKADEFTEFFINYRYNILDRPVSQPVIAGGVWTIPGSSNPNKLGWVPANSTWLPGYTIPTGAKFFYYIPSNLSVGPFVNPNAASTHDTSLYCYEEQEAAELGSILPPIPNNFVQLTVNGVVQPFLDEFCTDGIYKIDNYGIWWFSDTPGTQPWADSISGAWTLSGWHTYTSSVDRPRIFLTFSRFNPALRLQLVSSLSPYVKSDNDSSQLVRFYSKENPTVQASTGDLLVKVIPQFESSTAPSATAVASLGFNVTSGKFTKATTPVVSSITGSGGISVAAGSTAGSVVISQSSVSASGTLDSLEPVNSRLEFRGLHSYIKLPYSSPVTTPYGLIGKIVLPVGTVSGNLQLVLHLFGDSTDSSSAAKDVSLDFDYAITQSGQVVNFTTSTAATSTFNLVSTTETYTQYTVAKIVDSTLVIPVLADSVVNFQLTRAVPSSDAYTGNIGILGIYWSIQ